MEHLGGANVGLYNWELVANKVQVDLMNADVAHQISQQVQVSYGTPQVSVQLAVPQAPRCSRTWALDIPNNGGVSKTPGSHSSRVRHANGERVSCLECGKSYACNANLRDHMRIHTGERPFECDECEMTFTQRSNLRMHKRVHTGERPYMCAVCGKTFSRSSHLPGHMRQHTGEKPYTCEECGQTFTTKQSMKNHFRIHTGEKPYSCDVCDAAFTQSSTLSTHKKSHTGEKPFKCDICNKRFIFRSGLNEHMIVHSTDKPYQCDQCHKRFKYSNYLSKHKKKYCGNDGYRKRWQNCKGKKPTVYRTGSSCKSASLTRHSASHILDDIQGGDGVNDDDENEDEEDEDDEESDDDGFIDAMRTAIRLRRDQQKYGSTREKRQDKKIPLHIADDGDWKKAWIKQGYK